MKKETLKYEKDKDKDKDNSGLKVKKRFIGFAYLKQTKYRYV